MTKMKLSKAEQLAADVAKWTAKRDAAISSLIKANDKLVQLQRSQKRVLKAVQLEQDRLAAERKAKAEQRKAARSEAAQVQ